MVALKGGVFVRRCPTLPHSHGCSTIGAEGLSFRVRDVSGRFPLRYDRRNLLKQSRFPYCFQSLVVVGVNDRGWLWGVVSDSHSGRKQFVLFVFCVFGVDATRTMGGVLCGQVVGLLVPVSSTHCCASTSGLSTQSSSWEPSHRVGDGNLILERASRLDAFSGYHFRT